MKLIRDDTKAFTLVDFECDASGTWAGRLIGISHEIIIEHTGCRQQGKDHDRKYDGSFFQFQNL